MNNTGFDDLMLDEGEISDSLDQALHEADCLPVKDLLKDAGVLHLEHLKDLKDADVNGLPTGFAFKKRLLRKIKALNPFDVVVPHENLFIRFLRLRMYLKLKKKSRCEIFVQINPEVRLYTNRIYSIL